MLSTHEKLRLEEAAHAVREIILEVAHAKDGGHHLGGGLSIVEVMCYLYGRFLDLSPDDVKNQDRDRFILSKGHGVLGFYPVLNYFGYISKDILSTYKTPGSDLIAHPVKNKDFGIESSNGSLGHGLSYATGIAYGLRLRSSRAKVVALVGDGECNEGSVWEAIMSAASLGLSNLYLIIDFNGFQSDGESRDIINQSNLDERLRAFGWSTHSINGHSFEEIECAFASDDAKPKAVIAHTIKGKGIDFMEGDNSYHHSSVTLDMFEKSIASLRRDKK